jgi:hypothetical protein
LRSVVFSIVLLGGCSFSIVGEALDAAGDDVRRDDASTCVGTGLVRVCLTAPPPATLILDTQLLDTDAASTCTQIEPQLTGRDLCVIAATNISVTGVVTTTGSRPLVLAALGSIRIEGTGIIDVSSTGTRVGAGAGDASCDLLVHRAGTGEGDSGGGGGGAGGGFGTLGGGGGRGDDNDNQPPTPHKGIAGTAGVVQPNPTTLRGGCRGGSGGGGANNILAVGPSGGDPGGAVSLIARGTIVITGNVFSSGGGGRARSGSTGFMDGGAGGGSGGMIAIDAPMIEITGIVAANGGAGSGGGDINGGVPGPPGSTTGWNTRALGGDGDPCCGARGGDGTGGAFATPTGGGIDISGGGGGGGGAGVVWIDGTVTGATQVSPAPTPH